MEKLKVLMTALYILNICPMIMAYYEDIFINDGLSHTFDSSTYRYDSFYLDEAIANIPGTHVNMVNGGLVKDIYAYNSSSVTIDGGILFDAL